VLVLFVLDTVCGSNHKNGDVVKETQVFFLAFIIPI